MTSKKVKELTNLFRIAIENTPEEKLPELLSEIAKFLSNESSRNRKQIFLKLKEILYKKDGILEVTLSSAEKLNATNLELLKLKIISQTRAKSIDLNERIDQTLVAGIKYQYGDVLYDATLKHKMNLLKKQLTI